MEKLQLSPKQLAFMQTFGYLSLPGLLNDCIDEVIAAFEAVWDDHEFSDDSHGATATYTDGRSDETDVERRKNANQAWFEFMPVDYMDNPNFQYDPDATKSARNIPSCCFGFYYF
jgi:hypothetical protein